MSVGVGPWCVLVRCAAALSLAALLLVGGCAQVPPAQLAQARFDYGHEIAESWKRQTLMNVVRLRYNDTPAFLDVAGVVTSDSLTTKLNAGSTVAATPPDSKWDLGVAGTWTSSPTVSFAPIRGERFSKRLLEPMSPISVLMLVQAGWPVEVVWPTMVSSVNSLQGQALGVPADQQFVALQDALARLQRARALGFRIKSREPSDGLLMVLHREELAPVAADARQVRALLGLQPGVKQVSIAYGEVQSNDRELALNTRSMLEVLQEMGTGVAVPEDHAAKAPALAPYEPHAADASKVEQYRPLVAIRSGSTPPADAYAAVPYKGHWFWVDDNDERSKRLFTFLMILFSLSDTSQPLATPVLSISPAH